MKFFLLLGGTAGFLLAFSSGLMAGNEISIALRDGAIGCLAGAFLMKGFHGIFMMCLRDMAVEKARARATTNANE
jgi:hypothetical protein